jgi:hypothetical protein
MRTHSRMFRAALPLLAFGILPLPSGSAVAQDQASEKVTPLVRLSSTVSSIETPGGRLTRRETEFNPKTGVWSVFFDPDGSLPEAGGTSLILNFYGWNPASSAEDVAQRFVQRYGSAVIFRFQAPDSDTKKPAYFLLFEDIRTEKGYGYADITKVATVDNGAYAITLSRRIRGKDTEEIDKGIRAWLLTPEGKAATSAVSNMTVDATWRDALKQQQ